MTRGQAILNLQAGVVLAASLAAWVFVPPEILLPLAAILVAVAVAGVFGIRYAVRGMRDEAAIERFTQVGMALALVGLAAFMVLLMEYAD